MTGGHRKIAGFVDHIERGKWWARLDINGHDYIAEMKDPLPAHARHGSYFTIHTTKRGHTYLYWITKPLITQRQIKKARQWASRMHKALFDPEEDDTN
jgi:hypothetical protein